MHRALHFWVAGGDLRQVRLAQLLQEDGHTVQTYAMEHRPQPGLLSGSDTIRGMEQADCVILPLPVTAERGILNASLSDLRIPVEDIFEALSPGQLVCAGKVPPKLRVLAERKKLILRDYFEREELAVANAVPTAEGAIQIAMEELTTTIFGLRVLVIGFGRIGKILAHRLQGMGAKVTVSARKYSDLAWIEAYGYTPEHTGQLTGWLGAYDLIINTVPSRVLELPQLTDLKENCLVIDLASRPGGVDRAAAAQLGVKVIWALSLPGKVAPDTSGRIIKDTVYHILQELEL
ncbi:MAG: dipicolinate synthase subunit DpsA [Oscillospiraceae bacterium]|nr:dipicolinate synthase subunit DpsA [Oscillospiraceae bacterium]